MKRKIKAGLIGVGEWGKYIVKTLNNDFSNISLDCVSFRKSKYKDLLPKNCKIYANWKKMISNENLNCIFVATPPQMNLQIFREIKKKKIPLFLEKPLASNLSTAKKIYNLSKNYSQLVQINHIDLFNKAIIEAKRRIKMNLLRVDGFISSSSPNRSFVSPLWDYSPHFIALVLTFFKELPTKIKVTSLAIDKNLKNREKRQMTCLQMKFGGNKTAKIYSGNGTVRKIRKINFITKDKKYIYDNNSKTPLVYFTKKKKKKYTVKIKNELSLTSSIDNFLKNLKNGSKKNQDIYLGFNVVKILHLADKSLKLKKTINFLN